MQSELHAGTGQYLTHVAVPRGGIQQRVRGVLRVGGSRWRRGRRAPRPMRLRQVQQLLREQRSGGRVGGGPTFGRAWRLRWRQHGRDIGARRALLQQQCAALRRG